MNRTVKVRPNPPIIEPPALCEYCKGPISRGPRGMLFVHGRFWCPARQPAELHEREESDEELHEDPRTTSTSGDGSAGVGHAHRGASQLDEPQSRDVSVVRCQFCGRPIVIRLWHGVLAWWDAASDPTDPHAVGDGTYCDASPDSWHLWSTSQPSANATAFPPQTGESNAETPHLGRESLPEWGIPSPAEVVADYLRDRLPDVPVFAASTIEGAILDGKVAGYLRHSSDNNRLPLYVTDDFEGLPVFHCPEWEAMEEDLP